MVRFDDDPYAPVTTARVYESHDVWLDTWLRDGRETALPNGFVRERLTASGATERERQAA